jgi:hypothetical protein
MRGKQRKLQRCVQGSYGPLYGLSRNEHRGYSNSAWVPASGLGQLGAVDVRIEESSISSPRGHMVEGKTVIVVGCLVENPARHF